MLFPIMLAALLAGLSFWLEHYVTSQGPRPDGRQRHDPDTFAENAVQERFDLSGKRLYVLVADKLTHFPDDDTTHVVGAHLEHYGKPQTLYLRSNTALVQGRGTQVFLSGDVQGRRAALGDLPESTFSTSELTIVPDDEHAFTDKPVHMTRGRSVLDGVGLDLDQINGIAVVGKVHATVYPKSKEGAR